MTRRRKPQPKPVNLDDAWCDVTRQLCAKAIVEWLKGSVNVQRSIQSLSLAEMSGIAEAAVSCWIVAASKRISEEPEKAADEGLTDLLFA